jgi:hypothetical protein
MREPRRDERREVGRGGQGGLREAVFGAQACGPAFAAMAGTSEAMTKFRNAAILAGRR